MTRRILWSLCALGITAAAATAQTTITQWNFNSNPSDGNDATGTLSPSFGFGTASCFNIAPSGPLSECVFGNGDSNGGSSDPQVGDDSGWQTRGYQAQGVGPGTVGVEFAVSTANFTDIIVTWDHRHSNTSSRFVNLFYSTDGVNFTEAPNAPFEGTSGDTWFNGRTVNLSSIPGAGNNPNFRFRISPVFDPSTGNTYAPSTAGGTYAPTGTHRFDMVTVSGTAIATVPPSGTATAIPGAVCAGGGTVSLQVSVVSGINPPSTGLAVRADLTSVGGSAMAMLFDDGTNGDTTPGDNLFTLNYTVPGAVGIGLKNIPITITDAQTRSSTTSLGFTVADCSTNSTAQVVISQVYGGGANAGPPAGVFNADFIELFNRSASTVDLTGWSVQYASPSSAGGFDNPLDQVLLSGSIKPGQYLLIQFSEPGSTGAPLPAPDFAGTGGMGNTGGRVALVRSASLIGTVCNAAAVEDLVGYGAAACFEGAAPTAPTANDTAAIRKIAGAQDTNQNFNDFAIAAPTPRNRAFGGFLAGYGSLSASALCAGSSLGIGVNVAPATSPASTGIQVVANLTALGGPAAQPLTSSGGSNWSLNYVVPASVTQGVKSILVTTSDAQGRTDTATLSLTIATCNPSPARVVVSGFFGGGGNAGSPFNADHIEIFNRSGAAVNLNGWSVQYADGNAAPGFLATRTIPLAGTIGAGEYRLIQTSAPGANGVPLPTPDFSPATPFGMDNESGRIAIVRTPAALGPNCTSADIEDLVGYGDVAICFEGIAPTANITNFTGGYRKLDGCQDFNHSALDFDILAPVNFPRSSATPANLCPQPSTGACCCGASCTITTAAACTGANRSFAGPGTSCTPFSNTTPCCRGDYNKSGAPATVQDIFDFLAGYFSNDACADANDSGGAPTVQDIFDFLSAYFGGGC